MEKKTIISRIVETFLTSRLSLILVLVSLCLGAFSIYMTPKEEEPQIVVPMADIFVAAPGADPGEIEKLVATPLEQILWEIDGVEYVYSMSRRESAVVTVRFFVGEDRENSLLKLHNKIQMNLDRVPPIVENWLIKPVEIDDVPILTLTLYSPHYSDHEIRRVGEEVAVRISRLENISRSEVIGGRKREIRIEADPFKMKGFGISFADITKALKGADDATRAGSFDQNNQNITLTSSSFLTRPEEVKSLVIAATENGPVYLSDVADVLDGPQEATSHTRMGFSNAALARAGGPSGQTLEDSTQGYPAVTLAFSKKKGTNAVAVADNILAAVREMEGEVIPHGIHTAVTRNYGETAREKVNELLSSLGFAVASVVLLLALTLGYREAAVVALAVPISFSLALFMNFIFGYTINRVTLFALILSLGLVVDDPITNVDNIQRHIRAGVLDPLKATLYAVSEVLPPVLMSTLAIIVCFTPLFFITGMMGPYMGPMAINVPLTVTFSTLCALTVVPWVSYHLLKNKKTNVQNPVENPPTTANTKGSRIYKKLLTPFLEKRSWRWGLVGGILILLVASAGLGLFRLVPLKLLPFDNKNEFQILLDLPEGTALEQTDRVVREFEDYLRRVNEVTHFVSYTGTASPMDFNGMVRHYFIRKGSHLADIRVNLAHKDIREQQSHTLLLRLRSDLEDLAKKHHADLALVEVPPGPPVLSTLVAEVYGRPETPYDTLLKNAHQVKEIMASEPFVTDVSVMDEAPSPRVNLRIDREKAALHGIETRDILTTLETAMGGATPASLHLDSERHPLWIKVILPRALRSDMGAVTNIPVRSKSGALIPLGELAHLETGVNETPIYHKNMAPVVYVLGEMAGRAPGEAVLDIQKRLKTAGLDPGIRVNWAGEGEWKITLRVFRDMGLAFAAALVGIYFILVMNTGSYSMPLLIMMAIPLTILGIMPGFFILNLFTDSVGGYADPVFFTATSMIGMIALGGIVIRNSLVLIEFIQEALKQGMDFTQAILASGTARMRPILLTALTTAIGAFPITLDPVFSGLAWALIFGLFASTLFTLVVIPVTYFAIYNKKGETP